MHPSLPPLRPFQKKALATLEHAQDVLCVAPTGSGKSRIFLEYLERNPRSRALLFSPLVALNRQHARHFRDRNIPVRSRELATNDEHRESRVWILSPESLLTAGALGRLRRFEADLVIVDEAHCIWEWGRSFRPAFPSIAHTIEGSPKARTLWLSATLTPAALAAIRQLLPEARRERVAQIGELGVPRTLSLRVEQVPWSRRVERLLQEKRRQAGKPGVVFCPTRELTEKLAQWLHSATPSRSAAYHAGLSREERASLEGEVRKGRIEVLCATTAFGMGVDLPELRWCALWEPPSTLLALAQQIGRVTRTEQPASALLLWDEGDFVRLAARNPLDARESLPGLLAFYRGRACRKQLLLRGLGEGPREGTHEGPNAGMKEEPGPDPSGGRCTRPHLCDRCLPL
jgi:ATP-dependent DNA helicase RecQ